MKKKLKKYKTPKCKKCDDDVDADIFCDLCNSEMCGGCYRLEGHDVGECYKDLDDYRFRDEEE